MDGFEDGWNGILYLDTVMFLKLPLEPQDIFDFEPYLKRYH